MLLQNPIDWPAFAKAASFHGVVLSVFPRLEKEFKTLAPDLVFESLQGEYNNLCRIKWLLFGKLLMIHKELVAAGIKVIAYKGPLTATAFYGDVLSRQFSDIDLLVSPADFLKTYRLLLERGLKPFHYEKPIESNFVESRVFQRLSFEVSMSEPRSPLSIDLHWRVRPEYIFPVQVNELLSWCEDTLVEGQQFRTFSAGYLLVIHCLICSTDLWHRLTWISDTAHILARNDLDWDKVESLAKRLRCLPMLSLGMSLANAAFHTSIPDRFLQMSQSKEIAALTDSGIRNLANTEFVGSSGGAHWQFDLLLRPSVFHKLSFILQSLVEPDFRCWERLRLPDYLIGAYYPLQMIWQLQRLKMRSWQLMRSGK